MTEQSEIAEVVDEIVDDLDPPRIEREADRFGMTTDQLIVRVIKELNDRLGF